MHSHARYTSESSNNTDESASTDQTYVSVDGITSNGANNSRTYPKQTTGYLGETSNAAAVGFNGNYDLITPNAQFPQENRLPYSEAFIRDPNYRPELSPLLRHDELVKLKKNYKSLRRMFLILAFLCIILIICVISVFPMMMVSFRMDNSKNNDQTTSYGSPPLVGEALKDFMFVQLSSKQAKEIVQKHMLCVKCGEIGDDVYRSKSLEDLRELQCCNEDIFTDFSTFKDDVNGKFVIHNSDMTEHDNRIVKLEDEVIDLTQNDGNETGNNISQSSFSDFERSVLQGRIEGEVKTLTSRMEENNRVLNQLLGFSRSSIQLKGTVNSNYIEWQRELSNGDIMLLRNNKIHVRSGGTYFIYVNVQFTNFNCTKHEEFQYELVKERRFSKNPVARVKHTCTSVSNSFDFNLNMQKVVEVQRYETVSFYLNVTSNALSDDPWAHAFGIIEM